MNRPIRWYDYITININWFALTTRSQVLVPLVIPLLVPPVLTLALAGFTAVDVHMSHLAEGRHRLADFAGRKKLLNIVPSLDTAVCATSARRFNEQAAALENCVVLVVSADLPFAQKRFCTAEGLDHVIPLSMMRSKKPSGCEILTCSIRGRVLPTRPARPPRGWRIRSSVRDRPMPACSRTVKTIVCTATGLMS